MGRGFVVHLTKKVDAPTGLPIWSPNRR